MPAEPARTPEPAEADAVLSALGVPVVAVDAAGTVRAANEAYARVVARSRDALVGARLADVLAAPPGLDGLLASIGRAWESAQPDTAPDLPVGEQVWRAVSTALPAGDLVVQHLLDVTDLHEAVRAHRLSQDLQAVLWEHSRDLTFFVRPDGSSAMAAEAYRRAVGVVDVTGPLGAGRRWGDTPEVNGQRRAAELLRRVCALPEGSTLREHIEFETFAGVSHSDVQATNRLAHPAVQSVVMNVRDVTDEHERTRRLQQQAMEDPLTGLPNRRWFIDALTHALGRSARSGLPLGILLIDVDGFKAVNDSLGHSAGDRLLAGLAGRMAASLRPGDSVARIGGDEFVVLAEELRDPRDAISVASRLEAATTGTYAVGSGRDVDVTLSIGVSTAVGGGPGDALLARADAALYAAKRKGRGRVEVFGEDT